MPRDSVARVDGGCFGLLCPRINGSAAIFKVVEKVQRLLAPITEMPQLAMPLSYSIGVAVFPDGDLEGNKLAHAARLALGQAKRQRGISCRYFTHGMEQTLSRRQSMESSLRRALRREEFVLQYQPQIDLHTSQIKRVEALIRWQQPGGHLVGPRDFLEVAEQTGLLVGLGHWGMHRVCEDLKHFSDLKAVINVGHSQISDSTFVDTSFRIVAQSGVSLNRIGFELNEANLQVNPEEVGRRIQNLTDEACHSAWIISVRAIRR